MDHNTLSNDGIFRQPASSLGEDMAAWGGMARKGSSRALEDLGLVIQPAGTPATIYSKEAPS